MAEKKKLSKKINDKKEKINKAIDDKISSVAKKATTKKKSTAKKSDAVVKKPNLAAMKESISAKKQTKKKKKKNTFLVILTSGAIILLSLFLVFMLYIVITAPKFDENELYNKEATIIYDANGDEIAKIGSEKRELVTYDELPQVLVDAIVATEDSRFFQHNGFDLPRFLKASFGQLTGNSAAGGASTLTMQVVKNTFTSTESKGLKGIIRKFTDIYMSIFKVEKNYTKEEIIEFYVNAPWLGNNTYGIEQACQMYFGKSVRDLTLAEASLMAGLFQAPSTYNPFNNPEAATKRRNTVLKLMVKHGYITEEEADLANSISVESLLTTKASESANAYQGFIDTVIEDVKEKTGNDPYNTPMLIYSTMEKDAQDVINNLYAGEYYTWINDVIQAGIAITSVKDGSVVAVGAGRNRVGERQFNYATMINRHPGSTAKPFFAYGPYLEYNNGNTGSIFFDEPMTYSDGTPLKNADGNYQGMMTMKTALYKSRNIPAIQAFQQLDKEKVSTFVHNLGIDYGDTLYESAAIGGFNGMSPLSMSAAYAAFARGGEYIEPYTFTKIVYRQDDRTIEPKVEKMRAMSEETAYMMNYMLTYAGANGVGGKINVSGTDVAAKTGTSTVDEKALEQYNLPDSTSMDNWVAVYSPDYSISLWYGYKELSSEYYTTSINAANQRVRISAALANRIFKKNSKFSVPDGVVEAQVELGTNPAQKPSSYTPSSLISTEYFNKNSAPTETSSRFTKLNNPTNGNASVSGNAIKLTWNGISTPNALNSSYLEEYMKKAYGNQYERYLKHMKSYNEGVLGNVGYEVYLKDGSGNLTDLGFTEDTSFTYTMTGKSSYSFVVKSTYSNYKSNMSDGITINVNGAPIIGGDDEEIDDEEVEITAHIDQNCLPITPGSIWEADNNIRITVNGKTASDVKYYYFKSDGSSAGSSIPLDEEGVYTIKYDVEYNGATYSSKSPIRIQVSSTCS